MTSSMHIYVLFLLLALFCICDGVNKRTERKLERAEMLSELPMELLLKKRKSVMVDLLTCNKSDDPLAEALVNPLEHMQIRDQASNTKNNWPIRRLPVDRGQYDYEEDDESYEWMSIGKGQGKLGQIFDVTVSALSFLAFGGYLLCLLLHVVKEKNNNQTTTATTNMQLFLANQPIRQQFRPGRRKRSNEPEYDDPTDEDSLFNHLIDSGILLAEGMVRLY